MRNVSAMPEVGGRLSAMRSIELSIRGMTCAACAARIEKKLNMFDQDVGAAVSFATEKATITAAETVLAQALVAAVEGAGYAAEVALPAAEAEPGAGNQPGYLRRRLILALVSFVPLSGWSAYAMFHLDRGPEANALQELAHASGGGIYLEVAAAVMTFLLAGRSTRPAPAARPPRRRSRWLGRPARRSGAIWPGRSATTSRPCR